MEEDKEKTSGLAPGVRGYDSETLAGMLPHKIQVGYKRPSFLEIFAMQAVVMAERSACLWNRVGAIIFEESEMHSLASGYNGPAKGDVDPRDAGCARVVDGVLQKGAGLCRGSHAELNAIGRLAPSVTSNKDLSLMVTLHPCFSCSKQIVNAGITKVYYLWSYSDSDGETTAYLERLGVSVHKFTSPSFEAWVELNNYRPVSAK